MASREKTNIIIMTGLMMALTAVATMAIAIPVPFSQGYIHLGDSMVFVSVLLLGWKYGAIAASVGSAMADVFLGFVHWAPWTFVIKGLMAVLMGILIEKTMEKRRNATVAIGVIAVFWLGFHIAVGRIVAYQATHHPSTLLTEEVPDLTALGSFLSGVQNQLMIVALIIPVFLALVALLLRKREHFILPLSHILGMTLAGIFMVFSYYVAAGVMYGNFAVAAFSIPANVVQFVGGFLVAALLVAALSKTPARNFFAIPLKRTDQTNSSMTR